MKVGLQPVLQKTLRGTHQFLTGSTKGGHRITPASTAYVGIVVQPYQLDPKRPPDFSGIRGV